jgi:hypothetical protein
MLIGACLMILLTSALARQGAKDADDTTTVLGCIQRSQQNYTITDNYGASYRLDGVGDQLSGEVGHTLEVKGKLIQPTKTARHTAKQSFRASDDHGTQFATLRIASVIDDVHRLGNSCPSQ